MLCENLNVEHLNNYYDLLYLVYRNRRNTYLYDNMKCLIYLIYNNEIVVNIILPIFFKF